MTRTKAVAAASALALAAIGFAGTANAATFLCNPAPSACAFDGVTGGFSNVKRAPKQTASDLFRITFASAGTALLSFTSAKLTFGKATFDGITFTPVSGTEYAFDIAKAGTYDLSVSVSNLTRTVSSYSGTIDFAAVPEPTSWGLMIAGFGLAGIAMRRRAQQQPRSAFA